MYETLFLYVHFFNVPYNYLQINVLLNNIIE